MDVEASALLIERTLPWIPTTMPTGRGAIVVVVVVVADLVLGATIVAAAAGGENDSAHHDDADAKNIMTAATMFMLVRSRRRGGGDGDDGILAERSCSDRCDEDVDVSGWLSESYDTLYCVRMVQWYNKTTKTVSLKIAGSCLKKRKRATLGELHDDSKTRNNN